MTANEISKFVHEKGYGADKDLNSIFYFSWVLENLGFRNIVNTNKIHNEYWCCDIEAEYKNGVKCVFELKAKKAWSTAFGDLMCDYNKVEKMRDTYPDHKKYLVNLFGNDEFGIAEIQDNDVNCRIDEKEMPKGTYFNQGQKELQKLYYIENDITYFNYETLKTRRK